jgi:transglutaminase-like putative cysteine protease
MSRRLQSLCVAVVLLTAALPALAASSRKSDAQSRLQSATKALDSGERKRAIAILRALDHTRTCTREQRKQVELKLEQAGATAEAIRIGRELYAAEPGDADLRASLTRLSQRTKDTQLLRFIATATLTHDPSDMDARVTLARLDYAEGRQQQAMSGLREIQVHYPENIELIRALAELEQRGMGPSFTPAPMPQDDARWLADPNTVAASDSSFAKSAPAVMLSDVRIDHVHASGVYSEHVQQLVRLNTLDAVREYIVRALQFSNISQTIRVEHARLHKADGRVIMGQDDGEEAIANTASSIYYDSRRHILRFPGAQPGDTIELDYRLEPTTEYNPYGRYFASLYVFRDTLPVMNKRVVVQAPPSLAMTALEHDLHSSSTSANTWVWEAHNLEALRNEPSAPGAVENSAYAHVSTLGSWKELGKWYSELVAPQMELSPEMRAYARRLQNEQRDARARMNAIYQFVTRQTRYTGLEFGVYSYKPYPVSQVYTRHFGDCKDKASLMIALLRASGIQAEFAMVRTRAMGKIDPNAVSVSLFDHAIVYVPQFDLFLDGTADFAEPGELPDTDQGALAVTVSENGVATVRNVPVLENNAQHRDLEAVVSTDGSLKLTGRLDVEGAGAAHLRRESQSSERQRSELMRTLGDSFNSLKFENTAASSEAIQFSGQEQPKLQGKTLSLRSTLAETALTRQFATLESRREELLLQPMSVMSEEFRFRLPAGAQVSALPEDAVVQTPFGNAQIHFTAQNSSLTITSEVHVSATKIDPQDYEEFRRFCESVDEVLQRDVKVTLP